MGDVTDIHDFFTVLVKEVPRERQIIRNCFQGFRDGSESCAQLCVYHRGEKVIDVCGVSDPTTAEDYDEDTLQIVYSSSKAAIPDVILRFLSLTWNEKCLLHLEICQVQI